MFSLIKEKVSGFLRPNDVITPLSPVKKIESAYPHFNHFLQDRYRLELTPKDRALKFKDFVELHGLPPAQILFMELQMEIRVQNVKILSAKEAKALVDSTPDLVILDSRDPHEWAHHGRIANAKFLSEENFLETIKEFKEDTPLLTYCHFGVRSLNFAAQLTDLGFRNVHTIRGGIDEWSLEVDPTVPRYHGDYC